MPDTEVIDAVARALMNHDAKFKAKWDDYSTNSERQVYRGRAEVAIKALEDLKAEGLTIDGHPVQYGERVRLVPDD